MRIRPFILALAATATVAACGDTVGNQAVGGAAIGAGIAAITEGNLAKGAAIGAGANVLYCQANPGRCG